MSAFLLTGASRRLGRRGALIAGLVTLALAIALIVGLLGWAISNAQPPAQPSPSNAILAMARSNHSDNQYSAIVHAGVSARTGATIWSKSTPFSAAYVASADGVYYVSGWSVNGAQAIAAYRLSDGEELWSIPSPVSTPTQPMLVAHGLLLFTEVSFPIGAQETIDALDVTTHTLAWRASVPDAVLMDKVYSEIAVNDSMLFVGSFSGAPQPEISVTALRLRDGSVAWRQPVTSQVSATSLARWPARWLSAGPDAVYVADNMGAVTALRQSDGMMAWRSQPATNGEGGMQLTYSGASLYLCATTSDTGPRPLLALDPATGDTRWRTSRTSCRAPLIEADDVLYVADRDVIARRASDGALLWRVSPLSSGESFLSMQVDNGVVIAAASVIGQSSSICSTIFLPGQSTQCQDTGYLAAFNGASGALYWRVAVNYDPLLISDGWFVSSRPMYFAP